MNETDNTIQQDILEIVQFLKDNMVSKDDLDTRISGLDTRISGLDTRISGLDTQISGLDTRISEVKNELLNHIDGFIGLHQKLDIELTSLRAKYTRLEGHIEKLAKHLQLDLD